MEAEEPPLESIIYRRSIERNYTLLLAYILEKSGRAKREEALRELVKTQGGYEAKWVEDILPKLEIRGNDAKAAWALDQKSIQRMRPGHWKLEEHTLVKNTPEQVIVHDTSWCPLIEACKALGLEQRDVCSIFPGRNVDAVMKALNPKLSVRLGKMRPTDDYCEYQYILEP